MFRRVLSLLLMAVFVCCAAGVVQAQTDGAWFQEQLTTKVAGGELDQEQALIYTFYYGFDTDRLPADLRPDVITPLKCGTHDVIQYLSLRDELSAETRRQIDGYLEGDVGRDDETRAIYISPSGYFEFTYYTAGGNAVPTEDTDPPNGIPDFVERCAGYLDYSLEQECDVMGFTRPPVIDYYEVSFEAMEYYGYTQVVSYPNGRTRLVLHNTFQGFPPNDDPDGNVAGAAKVTCAHEFKHATQFAGSRWSEQGWVELDATWAEEAVYPVVNDYHNYVNFGSSPIKQPTLPLDDGGTGSYEDCVWQIWMSDTYGWECIYDLWEWRKTHSEWMMYSYDHILTEYGTNFRDAWNTFTSWNYPTSYRAITGLGYQDAAQYAYGNPPHPDANFASYPDSYSGSVNHMAANFIHCVALPDTDEQLHVTFDGQDIYQFTLAVVAKRTDGTGTLTNVVLDAQNQGEYTVPEAVIDLAWVGLVVGNAQKTGSLRTFTIAAEIVSGVAQPEVEIDSDLVSQTLPPDDTALQQLTLANVGDAGSVLEFEVAIEDQVVLRDPVTWLVCSPLAGSIPAGENEVLDLTFDSAGLAQGSYAASLVITHNGLDSPTIVPVSLTVSDTTPVSRAPLRFSLEGNYPNPFNPMTYLRFSLPADGPTVIEVFDLQGRQIRTLWNGVLASGSHDVAWDGRDDQGRAVSAGTYVARVKIREHSATTKMVLAK